MRTVLPLEASTPAARTFLFADGHTDFLSENINMTTYRNLSTINGGEVIPAY